MVYALRLKLFFKVLINTCIKIFISITVKLLNTDTYTHSKFL